MYFLEAIFHFFVDLKSNRILIKKRRDLVERSAPLSMSFYQSTKKGINKSATKSGCQILLK